MSIDQVAREWLVARNVIADFLEELLSNPAWPRDVHEGNAVAIIARLASHKPPILLTFEDEDDGK